MEGLDVFFYSRTRQRHMESEGATSPFYRSPCGVRLGEVVMPFISSVYIVWRGQDGPFVFVLSLVQCQNTRLPFHFLSPSVIHQLSPKTTQDSKKKKKINKSSLPPTHTNALQDVPVFILPSPPPPWSVESKYIQKCSLI
jgi:hypothetical protein